MIVRKSFTHIFDKIIILNQEYLKNVFYFFVLFVI